MEVTLIVIAVVILVPLIFVIATYNGLVRTRNHVDESWSGVETELQRRYDLIPNLVNTVKGYATHERELLENVAKMREQAAANHGSPESQARSENAFQGALGSLMARVEAYPELKANKNFLALQDELTNTEDRIQASRRFYNGNVRENNNKVQMFPSNIIAGMFSFGGREFFEIDEPKARVAPQVSM
jgi:LemA protein